MRAPRPLSLPGLALLLLALGCASSTPTGVGGRVWSRDPGSAPEPVTTPASSQTAGAPYTTAGLSPAASPSPVASPAELERAAHQALATDPVNAERLFQEILASHPARPTALLGLGIARLAQGDPAGAVDALEQASGLERSARTTATLGVAYDTLGRHERAQQLYGEALELRPEDVETLNNLGMSYTKSERFREAVYVFRGALTLRPGNAGLENNLAFALGRLGRYDDAQQHFRAGGTPSEAFNNLGYVAYLNGEDRRAIDYYERALAVAQDDKLTIIRNLRAARERHEARFDRPHQTAAPYGTDGAPQEREVQAWQLH